MDTEKVEMGKKIKAALDEAKVSQRRVALELNVRDSTVTYWCQGVSEPPIKAMKVISRLTGKSIDWFAGTVVAEPHVEYGPENRDADQELVQMLKDFPDAAEMMRMYLETPEGERRDALEVVAMYLHLPRSQRMRRKADILEDVERIEEKKGASEEAP